MGKQCFECEEQLRGPSMLGYNRSLSFSGAADISNAFYPERAVGCSRLLCVLCTLGELDRDRRRVLRVYEYAPLQTPAL